MAGSFKDLRQLIDRARENSTSAENSSEPKITKTKQVHRQKTSLPKSSQDKEKVQKSSDKLGEKLSKLTRLNLNNRRNHNEKRAISSNTSQKESSKDPKTLWSH